MNPILLAISLLGSGLAADDYQNDRVSFQQVSLGSAGRDLDFVGIDHQDSLICVDRNRRRVVSVSITGDQSVVYNLSRGEYVFGVDSNGAIPIGSLKALRGREFDKTDYRPMYSRVSGAVNYELRETGLFVAVPGLGNFYQRKELSRFHSLCANANRLFIVVRATPHSYRVLEINFNGETVRERDFDGKLLDFDKSVACDREGKLYLYHSAGAEKAQSMVEIVQVDLTSNRSTVLVTVPIDSTRWRVPEHGTLGVSLRSGLVVCFGDGMIRTIRLSAADKAQAVDIVGLPRD